ncbi:MAG: hypothetical protein HY761_00570 [Candidatus Omnitrophica bacterium]|nr:hypothetical protein [Candidatus Omnitrophota bacterium]
MNRKFKFKFTVGALIIFLISVILPSLGWAQQDHTGHMMYEEAAVPMQQMHMKGPISFYGQYLHTRESSGTSWQPDSSPMEGTYFSRGGWDIMLHGYVFGIYDNQGGKRGKDKTFSSSMFMLMADHKTSVGTFGFRNMLSLDPLMGKKGYPLLFQTGETYDGIHPLIDRQHPHDFFMEEALTYSLPLSEKSSLFGYFGLPGEPALGPPAFMHRFSAMDNPEAPLGHHWPDSTHITFGVITLGYVLDKFKVESSVFRGREPNQNRWDIESPKFDSYSGRITFNPDKNLSFQASYGYLDSPEQLEPNVNVGRTTISAMYNRDIKNGNWQTTFAWGYNNKLPGLATNAFLLESAINFMKSHTVFSRFEYVQKDELFVEDDPMAGKSYDVKKFTLGYIYDFLHLKGIDAGIGSSFDLHFISDALEEVYSHTPKSFMVFVRVKL